MAAHIPGLVYTHFNIKDITIQYKTDFTYKLYCHLTSCGCKVKKDISVGTELKLNRAKIDTHSKYERDS
jgi:hypothetical protein